MYGHISTFWLSGQDSHLPKASPLFGLDVLAMCLHHREKAVPLAAAARKAMALWRGMLSVLWKGEKLLVSARGDVGDSGGISGGGKRLFWSECS